MKKRYIVAIDSSTDEQNEKFLEFMKVSGLGWWHWIQNIWLISDPSGKFSAKKIRSEIKNSFPGKNCIVLEFTNANDTWAGFGPNTENKNMFKWIKDYWSK